MSDPTPTVKKTTRICPYFDIDVIHALGKKYLTSEPAFAKALLNFESRGTHQHNWQALIALYARHADYDQGLSAKINKMFRYANPSLALTQLVTSPYAAVRTPRSPSSIAKDMQRFISASSPLNVNLSIEDDDIHSRNDPGSALAHINSL